MRLRSFGCFQPSSLSCETLRTVVASLAAVLGGPKRGYGLPCRFTLGIDLSSAVTLSQDCIVYQDVHREPPLLRRAGHFRHAVDRDFSSLGLKNFLEPRLRILGRLFSQYACDFGSHPPQDTGPGVSKTTVQQDCTNDGFQSVCKIRRTLLAATSRFSTSHDQEITNVEPAGNLRQSLPSNSLGRAAPTRP